MGKVEKDKSAAAPPKAPKGRRHPGFPKGRQLEPAERRRVVDLIGSGPYKRDLLIEYLHLIQDAENCLCAGHLHGLADCLHLSMAEVYEVASFYDHFDIVKDGEAKPAPVTIRVCDSLSCLLAGADPLIAELEASADPAKIRIVRAPCMGGCDVAPAARIGNREIGNATA